MLFVLSITGGVGAAVLAWYYWCQLETPADVGEPRWLVGWMLRGLLAPCLLWLVLNTGFGPGWPPLLPEIEAAQSSGSPWVPVLLESTAPGLLLIITHWTGLTFGWLLIYLQRRRGEARDWLPYAIAWSLVMGPLSLAAILILQWWSLGLVATLWTLPIAHGLISQRAAPKPAPLYSRAIAKLKFGKYNEAEWEVINELEKFEDDYEGWMLLAELYATAYHDLASAEQTIRDLCAQPNVAPPQVAVALNKLADWYLKVAQDPVAARQPLEEICARLAGTHMEKMARLRLNQLPATREELQAQSHAKPLPLPALGDHPDAGPPLTREQAAAVATRCVELLRRNPNDSDARERFARVLAEHLSQTDTALDQVNLLLGMSNQPEKKRAEWIGLMAAWQLRFRKDVAAGKALLERLVREHPQTAQAFAAQQRLSLMAVEERIRKSREGAAAANSNLKASSRD
jgi:hypothetical protein